MERLDIDRRFQDAVDISHRREPAFESHRAHAFGEYRSAQRVHHEIRTLAAGRLHYRAVEIARAGADADVEPGLLEPCELFAGAGCADHAGVEGFGRLERGHAHA